MRPKRLADGAAMPSPNAREQRARNGMRGHAQPDAVLAAGDEIRRVSRARQDQRQRPGPERGGQRARAVGKRARPVRHVRERREDERSADDRRGGPLPRRCGAPRRAARVRGAQPVDGLGRKGDEFACAKTRRGARDRGGRRGQRSSALILRSPARRATGGTRGRPARVNSARIQAFAQRRSCGHRKPPRARNRDGKERQ